VHPLLSHVSTLHIMGADLSTRNRKSVFCLRCVDRLREPQNLKPVHTWLAERKSYTKHFKLFDCSIAVEELAGDSSGRTSRL
jgi:hypothetical protein